MVKPIDITHTVIVPKPQVKQEKLKSLDSSQIPSPIQDILLSQLFPLQSIQPFVISIPNAIFSFSIDKVESQDPSQLTHACGSILFNASRVVLTIGGIAYIIVAINAETGPNPNITSIGTK